MSQYLSENEFDTFHFHDCEIRDTQVQGDTSIWILSHIDVFETNKLNNFDTAMATDVAVITFYNSIYSNGKKYYCLEDGGKIEDLNKNDLDYINCCIKDGAFSYGEYKNNKAKFDIIQSEYLLSFNIEFSRVTVEWNEFKNKSWFVIDK